MNILGLQVVLCFFNGQNVLSLKYTPEGVVIRGFPQTTGNFTRKLGCCKNGWYAVAGKVLGSNLCYFIYEGSLNDNVKYKNIV